MCQREYLITRISQLLLVLLKRAYFPRIAVSHKCFSQRYGEPAGSQGGEGRVKEEEVAPPYIDPTSTCESLNYYI